MKKEISHDLADWISCPYCHYRGSMVLFREECPQCHRSTRSIYEYWTGGIWQKVKSIPQIALSIFRYKLSKFNFTTENIVIVSAVICGILGAVSGIFSPGRLLDNIIPLGLAGAIFGAGWLAPIIIWIRDWRNQGSHYVRRRTIGFGLGCLSGLVFGLIVDLSNPPSFSISVVLGFIMMAVLIFGPFGLYGGMLADRVANRREPKDKQLPLAQDKVPLSRPSPGSESPTWQELLMSLPIVEKSRYDDALPLERILYSMKQTIPTLPNRGPLSISGDHLCIGSSWTHAHEVYRVGENLFVERVRQFGSE